METLGVLSKRLRYFLHDNFQSTILLIVYNSILLIVYYSIVDAGKERDKLIGPR